MSSFVSVSELMNCRQSFGLAAWAVVGAGCDSGAPSNPKTARAQTDAPAQAAAPAPVSAPPEFAGLTDPVAQRFYERRGWRPAWNAAQEVI